MNATVPDAGSCAVGDDVAVGVGDPMEPVTVPPTGSALPTATLSDGAPFFGTTATVTGTAITPPNLSLTVMEKVSVFASCLALSAAAAWRASRSGCT